MRLPVFLRKKKEISIDLLAERLGGVDYGNLKEFTISFREAMRCQGIQIGLYAVGSFVYQRKEKPHTDIDLIASANDRRLLVPYKELPLDAVVDPVLDPAYDCTFSDRTYAALGRIEGMGIGQWRYTERMNGSLLPGRPNILVDLQEGHPIHLIVLYYNPLHFGTRLDGSDQYTYEDIIKIERKNKFPFCLITAPC